MAGNVGNDRSIAGEIGWQMGRRRKSGKRNGVPDEAFSAGPFALARFGRFMTAKSNASEAQWKEANARMAASFPKLVAELDALVASIAGRVSRLPPEQLLHRAWWEHAAVVIGIYGETSERDQAAAMRMIDYVQSVIASVPPELPYPSEVSEEDWAALSGEVRDLFERLTMQYPMCATAHRRAQDSELDMAVEEFRVRAELLWANVRGQRYQAHERQALSDVLLPHSDVLERLFGIDAERLVNELGKILAKLTRGLQDAFDDMEQVREATVTRMMQIAAETGSTDLDELRDKVFEDPAIAEANRKLAGEIIGYDLFDVELNTKLPKALLEELTWSPGEENEFFAPGELRGWPLRVWPTMKRPFIRLDGRIYCFDMFALFDNFYRVLQRAVFRLAPDYKRTWNERQKTVSEELPFTYFTRLLPGARVDRPVYYRWKSGAGPAQWHEADGLIAYDDHLLVIEVKAGAFTYTSPATDLPAHLDSLHNLVLSPARQGSRFVDYLESAPEVAIFDAEHQEIGRLRRADYRHVTLCAVTLDPFTELAARAQHLRAVGVDVGQRAVWALSIDDLRVYADLFDEPLTFLHYVEQRASGALSELVDLSDEFDHLGLYLTENNYSQFAAELKGKADAKLMFNGYRTPIDEYYAAIARGEVVAPPRQDMPARITEIVRFLAAGEQPGRSMLVSFLLDAAGDHRETIARTVEAQLQDNLTLGRSRPTSTYGDHAFTLFSWSPAAPRDPALALSHTRAVAAQAGEQTRLLIELEYDGAGAVVDVHWRTVGFAALSQAELARQHAAGRSLAERRVAVARARGKIGVNESCPCGSGRKYKRCHGRR